MVKEISKEEFKEVVSANRHEELSVLLNNILSSITKKNNSDIIESIQDSSKQLEEVLSQLPQPNINIDQDKVVSILKKMTIAILTQLQNMRADINEKHEWKFEITKRGIEGDIKTVIATQLK